MEFLPLTEVLMESTYRPIADDDLVKDQDQDIHTENI